MELTEAGDELASASGSDSSGADDLSPDEAEPEPEPEPGPGPEPGPPRKRARAAELRRPPTAEELVSLRDTQNLFHSNLFQLQTTEMLAEVGQAPSGRGMRRRSCCRVRGQGFRRNGI